MAADADVNTSGGYDCKFETNPPDEIQTECPVCLLVLREPLQLTCCGKAYCEACIREVLKDSSICPTCQASDPVPWPDKRLKQTLCGRRVRCQKRKNGNTEISKSYTGKCSRKKRHDPNVCYWVGELGRLDDHLSLDPLPEKQLEGCQFVMIKCKFCKTLLQRCDLGHHQESLCTLRPFKCKYCSHEDTFEIGTRDHTPVCPRYPVPCPHCGKQYERQELENHKSNECPQTPIACEYHVVGCEEKPVRLDMPRHIAKEAVTHVLLLQKHLKQHSSDSNKCLPLLATSLMSLKEEAEARHQNEIQNREQRYQQRICQLQRDTNQGIGVLQRDTNHRIGELQKAVNESKRALQREIKAGQEKLELLAKSVLIGFVFFLICVRVLWYI